jgi:hypothetical protein
LGPVLFGRKFGQLAAAMDGHIRSEDFFIMKNLHLPTHTGLQLVEQLLGSPSM